MAAKPPRSWLKSAGTASAQPPAATPRDAVSKAGGGARTAGSASASAADVGALGPRRPAPRSASLSPANFAPQTEAAFEKRPAQQPFGDPTCVRRAESEASRAAGVGSLAGGRWGRAPCEHLPRGATPDILAARARAGSWRGPRVWGSPAHAVAVECVQYGCWRPRVLLSPEDVLRPQSLSLESTKNAFV